MTGKIGDKPLGRDREPGSAAPGEREPLGRDREPGSAALEVAQTALPGLEAVMREAGAVSGRRGPAPVHLWNPPYCGDIGLEIRTDGSWWYRGTVIGRRPLVELFASVLRKDEDGETYLVTPAEKVLVKVADATFLGVELVVGGEGEGQQLAIRTNLDEWVSIGRDHPLRFEIEAGTGGLKPYVLVRGRLEARLNRELTRDLMALVLERPGPEGAPQGVWSGGTWWPLARE